MSLVLKDKNYFKIDKKAIPLARIENGTTEENKKIVYLIDNEEKGCEEISISKGIFKVLPRLDKIEKIYISAVSGAGKSYWVSNWLHEFLKKTHKEDPVYVFSSVSYDKNLDDEFSENIERIDMDEDLISDPLEPQSFEECVTVFDDVDSFPNKKIRNSVCSLRDVLLEIGRHTECRMLCTTHVLRNFQSTMRLLNESTTIVVFPKSGNGRGIRIFLKDYCGLNKSQISKFMKL